MKRFASIGMIKAVAFLLFIALSLTCVFSSFGVAFFAYNDAYENGQLLTDEILESHTYDMARGVNSIILHKIFLNKSAGDFSSIRLEQTNFLYKVKDKDGKVLITNMQKGDKMVNSLDYSDMLFRDYIEEPFDFSGRIRFTSEAEAKEYMEGCSQYFKVLDYEICENKYYLDWDDDYDIYYPNWYHKVFAENEEDTDVPEVHTTMYEEFDDRNIPVPVKTDSEGEEYYTAYEVNITQWSKDKDALVCTVGWREDMTAKDTYWLLQTVTDRASGSKLLTVALITALLSAVLFAFLLAAAGHKWGVEGIHRNLLCRIPYDLILTAAIAAGIGILMLFDNAINCYHGSSESWIFFTLGGLTASVLLLSVLSLITAVKVKSGDIKRNWLVLIIARGILRLIGLFPLYWQAFLILGLWFFGDMFMSIFFVNWGLNDEPELMIFFLCKIAVLPFIILAIVNLKAIQKGGEEITKGNVEYKINTDFMYASFRKHANNLNEIGSGLDRAVEEKLKSERMKTELITNVSHDIKTPLTSIINYVDILKREGLNSPNAEAYLQVIDRQSVRLKKLTEDLVEMSKASTGNISVDIRDVNANVLLSQAIGEYSEKLQNRGLETVVSLAENMPDIKADGNLMWRIFDNLLSNICKYAKTDTRVYLETAVKDNRAFITFKNISEQPLNISGDELMERFVRGDASRNTEGSGLGLSIAQSLARLQNADFSIEIDGDLFKSVISFVI